MCVGFRFNLYRIFNLQTFINSSLGFSHWTNKKRDKFFNSFTGVGILSFIEGHPGMPAVSLVFGPQFNFRNYSFSEGTYITWTGQLLYHTLWLSYGDISICFRYGKGFNSKQEKYDHNFSIGIECSLELYR